MPTKSNNTGGRGGARPGAGRKKTAVREKLENGNPGGQKLEVLDIPLPASHCNGKKRREDPRGRAVRGAAASRLPADRAVPATRENKRGFFSHPDCKTRGNVL